MNKLTIVDGTGKDKAAPRPRHGLIRAVYDTVEACGGAEFKDIQKYLPAAIESSAQVVTKRRLEKILYDGVYRGYLIHDKRGVTSKGYWRIAPKSYYEARHEFIASLNKQKHRKQLPQFIKLNSRPIWHWQLLLTVSAFSFLLGLIIGLYTK